MLHINFSFFNVESIREFTSIFLGVCSDTSYPFGFPSRSKRPPLEIINFLVTALINQDKKVSFVVVDADGALTRSSSFMKTCHNMNIIVQTKREDSYSLNGKGEDQIKHRII